MFGRQSVIRQIDRGAEPVREAMGKVLVTARKMQKEAAAM